jgi:predicted Zn-dependent protease
MHTKRILNISLICLFLCPAIKTATAGHDRRPRLLKAMNNELKRSIKNLKMKSFEAPYFMAFEMKENLSHRMEARYGAIFQDNQGKTRRLRVQIRVGDHRLDNIGKKNREFNYSWNPGYRATRFAPVDDDPVALRNAFWLLTDETYKASLKGFLKLKSSLVTEVDDDEFAGSFSREKAQVYISKNRPLRFDRSYFKALARTLSSRFRKYPAIFDSQVSIDTTKETRYLVNSEGTRLITDRILFHLSVHANTRAEDGMLISNQISVYAPSADKLPKKAEMIVRIDQLIANLKALRKAPVIDPYSGPAILDGEATGVLFHEVIGHRLEGERQLDDKEGKTFKGQVGKQIIPAFLSLIDDPTLPAIKGQALNGFYRYDDEGVPAQKVKLVERGKLKSFLTSRTPVKNFLQSNGHGRSAPGERPRARMGNTILKSSKQVRYKKLKEMLIAEVKRQGKPYGLIIKNILGGSTQTSTWGYQAYKGTPQMVYRIFPNGRKELVRGVEIVGTPLTSINKIVATSDKTSIFNGYCGAESGYVPVAAIAPAVLMTEIELQRTAKKSAKSPILPSPWLE